MDPVLDPGVWPPPLVVFIWLSLIGAPIGWLLGSAAGWWHWYDAVDDKSPWPTVLRWARCGLALDLAIIIFYTTAYYLVTLAVTLTEGITA